MYNRYIPQDVDYAPVPPQPSGQSRPQRRSPPPASGATSTGGLSGMLKGLLRGVKDGEGSGVSQALSSVLKTVGLKDLDTGDILLALIVLLLILEDGDDLDVLITLGLMILLNLGES